MDIAIIGGGIAGLSAALACARRGIEAHVFERSAQFAPVGASLSLWPNAAACLDDWGLWPALQESGAPIDHLSWRRAGGRAYFEQDMAALSGAGLGALCIRRSDLHRHSVAALPPERVHLNHALEGFEEGREDVALRFSGGVRVRAAHVIAADGVHSALRQKLLGEAPLQPHRVGAWLGLSRAPAPNTMPNMACEHIGPGGRLGVFETGADLRYWFFVAPLPEVQRHAQVADPAEVLEIMQDWPEPLRDVVAQSLPDQITRAPFYERSAAAPWGKGRFTLIGDAVHPFHPNLGQGACQSIEDGHWVGEGLARGLRGAALTGWLEQVRISRVQYFRLAARQVGFMARLGGLLGHGMRAGFGRWPMSAGMRSTFRRQFAGPSF